MHRTILHDTVNSQVFNDQFEVPGLEFLPTVDESILIAMTNKAFDLLVTAITNEDYSVNSVAGTIGTSVIKCLPGENQTAEVAAKIGCFFIFCFSLIGIFEVEIENSVGTFIDWDDNKLKQLWDSREKTSAIKPTLLPPKLVTSRIIRRGNTVIKPSETPILINTLEKMFNRGWIINKRILSISIQQFSSDGLVFKEYYKSPNPIARESKKSLCRAILDLAINLQEKIFYHKYFADFRGRLYPATGFLNEQGNDLAKSLVMLADGKELGKHGEKWIKHAIASHWAGSTRFGLKSDKLSVEQRVIWVNENIETFLCYASEPDHYTGWMNADSPWQFLAACIELGKIEAHRRMGEPVEKLVSHYICALDGSCNGSQHLAALTRDTSTAAHVNLRENHPVGDLYKYISEFVWNKINSIKVPNEPLYEQIIASVSTLRTRLLKADKDEIRQIYEEIKLFKQQNKEEIKAAAPLYWRKITEPNERRKIIKRNVMTMVYGVTRFGSGEQIIEDAPKHGIEYLEGMDQSWAIWLGQLTYDTMFEAMPTSTKLLKLFETAGKRRGNINKSLAWRTPLVNFPVVQDYRVGEFVKVKAHFFNEPLLISVRSPQIKKESPSKQRTGAPPNIVHSLDATHLMLTAEYCPEPLVTVHDSFGTLAGGMERLHEDVRRTFIMLYYDNPLPNLLKQLGISDLEIELGDFNIMEVANAEYCFL